VKVAAELACARRESAWVGSTPELARVKSLADTTNSWHFSDALSNGSLTTVAAAISSRENIYRPRLRPDAHCRRTWSSNRWSICAR
jgi:hypothetical protein